MDAESNMRIDVVIPIYNREKWIPNLICELNKQTMGDFRAIFVDDGSQDDSYNVLCKELENARFAYHIIQQSNGGAAAARNAGLRAAEADWIGFMDSDDSVRPEYLEYMYRAATESGGDLAICGYQMVQEGSALPKAPKVEFGYEKVTPAEAMRHYCDGWLGVYCLLIQRRMQQDKQLFFNESCRYCEDAPFITEVIEASTNVALIRQDLYFYCVNQGSLSRSPKLDKFLSGIQGFEIMEANMLASDSDAAAVFNQLGSARYYIATLRKAAVQMAYRDFKTLAKRVNYKRYRRQIRYLPRAARLASHILLISKHGFYYGIRLLFND